MKVLVAAASKHGSTAEIARIIGDVLEDRGAEVLVATPETVEGVDEYDAIILESAIYAGRWRKSAKEFIERNKHQLSERDVWLFSSGPLGDPAKPAEDPEDAASIIDAINPQGHHVFAGKLDRRDLNLAERAIVKGVGAAYGDFRKWGDIRRWASEIADHLDLTLETPGGEMAATR